MSELDGQSPMSREEFKRKHFDTHTELKAESVLGGATSGQFRQKNTISKEPGDKNAKHVAKLKKPIERECMEKQRSDLRQYLGDALSVRQKEILNKNDYSIKDLINAIIKTLPQQIDQKSEVSMNFADEIKRLTIESKKYKAIDAEES